MSEVMGLVVTFLSLFLPLWIWLSVLLPYLKGVSFGMETFFLVFLLLVFVLPIPGYYKVWRKMDNPDWMFFIPLLSDFWVLRVLGYGSLLIQSAVISFYFIRWKFMFRGGLHRSQIFIFLFMLFVLYVLRRRYLACSALSKGFGKGKDFAFGLFFLPIVFIQILGFGKAKWNRNEEKWKSVHTPSGYTTEKKHSALLLDKDEMREVSESQLESKPSKWKKTRNQIFSFVRFLWQAFDK